MGPMPIIDVADPELAELIGRVNEATGAYLRGEVRRYLELVPDAPDFSLMPPYGGTPVYDMDRSDEAIQVTSDFFKGGESTVEVYAAHRSGDLAVLVVVERQHGVVGDYPDQDLSLRVTWVFRRENEQWKVVHRHADPLVHPIHMDMMAALARGEHG